MKPNIVVIVNDGGHDFKEKVERCFRNSCDYNIPSTYTLTFGCVNIFNTDRIMDGMMSDMVKLKEIGFKPQRDYVVLSGSIILNVIFFCIVMRHFNTERINVLLWNAKDRKYIPREITF